MSPKEHLKQLRVLFSAMLFGQILLFGMLLIFVNKGVIDWKLHNNYLIAYVIGIVITLIGIILGTFLFARLNTSNNSKLDFSKRFENYRIAYIAKIALLEAPILINIMLFIFYSNSFLFFFSAILLILIFMTNYPSVGKLTAEMGLTRQESEMLL